MEAIFATLVLLLIFGIPFSYFTYMMAQHFYDSYLSYKIVLIPGQVYKLKGIGEVKVGDVRSYGIEYRTAQSMVDRNSGISLCPPESFRRICTPITPSEFQLAVLRHKFEQEN